MTTVEDRRRRPRLSTSPQISHSQRPVPDAHIRSCSMQQSPDSNGEYKLRLGITSTTVNHHDLGGNFYSFESNQRLKCIRRAIFSRELISRKMLFDDTEAINKDGQTRNWQLSPFFSYPISIMDLMRTAPTEHRSHFIALATTILCCRYSSK